DAGTMELHQISMAKLDNVRVAIDIARKCRTILGGNGITGDYSPLRHANNLESVRTYEGTDEVHTLIVGQHLAGGAAFSSSDVVSHNGPIERGSVAGMGLAGALCAEVSLCLRYCCRLACWRQTATAELNAVRVATNKNRPTSEGPCQSTR